MFVLGKLVIDDIEKTAAEKYVADEEKMLSHFISGDFAGITYPLKPLMMDIKEVDEELAEEKRILGQRSILSLAQISTKGVREFRDKLLQANLKLQQMKFAKSIRNTILQTVIAKYYRRKKMEYCLRESGDTMVFKIKYFEKLDEYRHIRHIGKNERTKLEEQIDNLQKVKDRKQKYLEDILNELYGYVAEVGHGLIFSKSGRTLTEKYCINFLSRIKNLGTSLAALRTNYITLKDRVAQRESDLSGMDIIGDSKYSLMYYEKLSTENRLRSDKVEEKEADLVKIRKVLQDNVQIVSHMREKAISMYHDITELSLIKEDMSCIIDDSRRWLNKIKCERDNLRSMLVEMKNESGFLAHPELLRDLQDSKEEHERLKKEFEDLKMECNTIIRQLRNARKFLETFNENQTKRRMTKRLTKKDIIFEQLQHSNKDESDLYKSIQQKVPNRLEDLKPIVKKLQVKYS